MQTTIELNDELFTQAQRLAERECTTLNHLIEDALMLRLRTASAKRRPPLPIYQGSGGLTASVTNSLTHRALLDAADETDKA
ncbi:MAG: DUF2191 domain-containing protein [Methylobacter sp.]|nr:MAG: DUF2191 domain-containing protein [Methylobacter sp.]PPD03403.1 MAG: DUF2191 domain-containing protein [Methylobacter sp.]PPD32329.1 MAG: DUF2191 domain-containing protein [Methylomonas sp.]